MGMGPFLTLKQAAEYCGYAPDTFRRKIRDYDIPRFGPENNKFAQSVLDEWMQSPKCFEKGAAPQSNRGRRQIVQLSI